MTRGEVLSYWGLLSGSKPELAYEGDLASLESGLEPWEESSLPREVRRAGCGFSVAFDARRPPKKLPLGEAGALRSGIGSETKGPPERVPLAEAPRSGVGLDICGPPPKRELLVEALRSGVG